MEGLRELSNALSNGITPTPYGLLFPKIEVRNPQPKLQSLLSLSHERVKLRTANLAGTFTGSIRTRAHKQFWRKGGVGVSRHCPMFLSTPHIISGMGKATNFKFCTHIDRIDRNKRPVKISGKVAVGVLKDSGKFSRHPYYIGRIARSVVIFAVAQLSCYILSVIRLIHVYSG